MSHWFPLQSTVGGGGVGGGIGDSEGGGGEGGLGDGGGGEGDGGGGEGDGDGHAPGPHISPYLSLLDVKPSHAQRISRLLSLDKEFVPYRVANRA